MVVSTNMAALTKFGANWDVNSHAGWYSFPVPLRVGGWVSLGGWLHNEVVCSPLEGHPSQYYIPWRLGIEHAKIKSNALTTIHHQPLLPSNGHRRSNDDCLRVKGKIIRSVCAVLCAATIVHSAMHRHMKRRNSCLLVRFGCSMVILCVTVYLC